MSTVEDTKKTLNEVLATLTEQWLAGKLDGDDREATLKRHRLQALVMPDEWQRLVRTREEILEATRPCTSVPEAKPGAIVRLRGGGPAMTIRTADASGFCAVSWFLGGEIRHDGFPRHALVTLRPAIPD